jgi:glutamyl-tRNA reductase
MNFIIERPSEVQLVGSNLKLNCTMSDTVSSKDALPFSRPTTPNAHKIKIGFVGLGSMGYLMARNLATHRISHVPDSPALLVWNRSTAKAEKLVKQVGKYNIHVAKDLAQVATECDVIITNLANDTVVNAVHVEFAKALTVRHVLYEWTEG